MNSQYKTNSLPLASYLYACSDEITFMGVDKTDTSNILFVFEPQEKAEELKDRFFTGKAPVENANTLFQNYHFLKDMIFEERRSSMRGRRRPPVTYR